MRADPPDPQSGFERVVQRVLSLADRAIYSLVALLFIAVAFAMVLFSVIEFFANLREDFRLDIVRSINDLLLVLIILEVLGTVRSYLATSTTSLRPFLYIGIISATRRILAVGAETSLGTTEADKPFEEIIIDLAVNAGVVLVLAAALFLFDRQQPTHEAVEEREAAEQRRDEG